MTRADSAQNGANGFTSSRFVAQKAIPKTIAQHNTFLSVRPFNQTRKEFIVAVPVVNAHSCLRCPSECALTAKVAAPTPSESEAMKRSKAKPNSTFNLLLLAQERGASNVEFECQQCTASAPTSTQCRTPTPRSVQWVVAVPYRLQQQGAAPGTVRVAAMKRCRNRLLAGLAQLTQHRHRGTARGRCSELVRVYSRFVTLMRITTNAE